MDPVFRAFLDHDLQVTSGASDLPAISAATTAAVAATETTAAATSTAAVPTAADGGGAAAAAAATHPDACQWSASEVVALRSALASLVAPPVTTERTAPGAGCLRVMAWEPEYGAVVWAGVPQFDASRVHIHVMGLDGWHFALCRGEPGAPPTPAGRLPCVVGCGKRPGGAR